MFGITTPLQFYGKLVQEFDEFCENPSSAWHAMNFVITAYHLHERLWKGFLKNDTAKRQALGITKDIGAFKVRLDERSIWYAQMQSLANGSKHFQPGGGLTIRMAHRIHPDGVVHRGERWCHGRHGDVIHQTASAMNQRPRREEVSRWAG